MAGAAEEIPRKRRIKQTFDEDRLIEGLDMNRNQLREVEDRSNQQKIEYNVEDTEPPSITISSSTARGRICH